MRFAPLLLLFAFACTPESPETVARRQFMNLRRGYVGYAEKLLTPDTRQQQQAGRARYDSLQGRPALMSELVVEIVVGGGPLQSSAFLFDVLETRVAGDTARLVVRRQWPNARALMARAGQDARALAARDSLVAAFKTRPRSPRNRRDIDRLSARQTAAFIAASPARFLYTDTTTYVLARQMNVWRIVDDGGLLVAPPLEPAPLAADSD